MFVSAAHSIVGNEGTVEAAESSVLCKPLRARYDADALRIKFFPRTRAHTAGNDDVHAAVIQKFDEVMIVPGAYQSLFLCDLPVLRRKNVEI